MKFDFKILSYDLKLTTHFEKASVLNKVGEITKKD